MLVLIKIFFKINFDNLKNAIARPGEIRFTEGMPKTRSGKIMRHLLRNLAAGKEIQDDTSTLENRSVLDKLREGS
jgi:acetyl-CoA synthetase